MAVHGTRNRESVSWNHAGVLEVLRNVARDRTGLPLLRCYWYEATVEGRRGSEHEILADLPGVKLRLGKMKPGRREGVASEIHRDLTTLARNRAISDALVVSAEEDLAQVIADVQDLGLRVILVHIAAPGWTAATALRQECDEIVEISEAHLRPSVEIVVGAEPAGEEERQAVPAYASRAAANGHGTPGVIGQPAVPVGSHAVPPGLYTGPVIARPAQAGPVGQPGPAALAGPPALPGQTAPPGQHAALPGHHAAPGNHHAGPPQHAAPGQPVMPPGQPVMPPGQPAPGHAAAHISGPLTAPRPAVPPQHAQALPRGGGQHAGPPSAHPDSGLAAGQHAQHGLPPQQFTSGQPMAGPVMPGQPVPGQPGAPAVAPGFQAPAGLPGSAAAQSRPGMPAYQAAPPPPPPPAVAPVPPASLAPPAAPPGFPGQAAAGQAPGVPRPPSPGAPPGPALGPPPGAVPAGAVPAGPVAQPGQQPHGVPAGYPAAPPGRPPGAAGDQRARQFPVAPGHPDGAMPGPHVRAAGAAQWPAARRAARPGASAGGGVPGRRGTGSARGGFQLRPGRRPGRAGALAGGRARPQAADAFRPRSQAVAGFLAAH